MIKFIVNISIWILVALGIWKVLEIIGVLV